MKRLLLLMPIALGGAFLARQLLTPDRRDTLARLSGALISRCLEQMPDDFPPKVMTFGVRRIQTQNDEILALLREQNELLRPTRVAARRRPARRSDKQ